MTGKKSDSSTPLSKAQYAALAAELDWHEQAAMSIESRTGQTDTYHHKRAAQLRAALNQVDEVKDGKLD